MELYFKLIPENVIFCGFHAALLLGQNHYKLFRANFA